MTQVLPKERKKRKQKEREMAPLMSSKWFSNKTLKLSLPHRRRKSSSSSNTALSPPSSPPKMVQENGRGHHQFQEAFRYLDSDGDGKISSEELRAFFASMGDHMSHDEAQGVISDHDTDGDALLDFQDFLRLVERDRRGEGGGDGDDDDDLRRAFEMFEVDKGCGCITPTGLQRMFQRLGDHKSQEECAAMIRVFDLDGNGVLDYHEFHRMMT